MKKLIITLVCGIFTFLNSYCQVWDSVTVFGSLGSAKTLTLGEDNNFLITGTFGDSIEIFDSTLYSYGQTDIFYAEFDSLFNFIKAKRIGGKSVDSKPFLFSKDGNRYFACYIGNFVEDTIFFDDSVLISKKCLLFAKFNESDSILWIKTFEMGLEEPFEMEIDHNGDICFAVALGHYIILENDTIIYDEYPDIDYCDYVNGKLDTNGNLLWYKVIKGNYLEIINDIAVDSNNNLYCAGYYMDNLIIDMDTFSGNWGFISKMDSDGNLLWVRQLESTNFCEFEKVIVDSDNNLILKGRFTGTMTYNSLNFEPLNPYDDFYLKTNDEGEAIWYKQTDNNTGIRDIKVGSDNSIIIVGTFIDSLEFEDTTLYTSQPLYSDSYVIKLDVEGNFQWVKHVYGANNEVIKNCSSVGNMIYCYGNFALDAHFDDITINSVGAQNLFLARLNTDIIISNYYSESTINLLIYPNPFKDYFILEFSQSEDFNHTQLRLFNNTGGLVDCNYFKENNRVFLETTFLKPGMYFIELNNGQRKITKKIIKL
ncbi:MAG: T9SS type A sorting domain-containing protein [Bacteroidales bacterium]|nr:T9SS type A sorting domain-containing protein [Bacteroidales bacterium]